VKRGGYKFLWAVLAGAFLAGACLLQRTLDRQRPVMGMAATGAHLKGAPPMLGFATMALGGFRGLIANALWMRASDLQEQDKYFEMVQLADWITKLQPRLKQVWIVQAWNMSYNISVKFTEPEDRWRWVQRGIELLRDEALLYNPDEPLIWRELGWQFLHKMGQDLDDAHFYYKAQWAQTMTSLLGTNQNSYLELIDPRTDDARARAKILREKYKMDPLKMKETDKKYGPLEWRLPEAHAIYWSKLALEKCRPQDLMPVRRNLYQAMMLSFQRGRLNYTPREGRPLLAPNLDIVASLSALYEQTAVEEPESAENIKRAHRNFLRAAVDMLYAHNRLADARIWFQYLREKYPDDFEVKQAGGDLDTFALRRVTTDVSEAGRDKTTAIIMGYLRTAYLALVQDDDATTENLSLMARKIWANYQSRTGNDPKTIIRVGLPAFADLEKIVFDQLMDPQQGLDPRLQAILRARLGPPAATSTNAPPSG
jgi:hypothetical protein